MIIVETMEALDSAFTEWYEKLVSFIVESLPFHTDITILEVGCGAGGLTIPLIERFQGKCRIIAFDLFSGPYQGNLEKLQRAISEKSFQGEFEVIQGDVRKMSMIEDESIDFLISNELFCDLDRGGLIHALHEFYRVIKPGGVMAHAELSPFPQNELQQLLIDADAHSLETMKPRPDWFSPPADEIAGLLYRIGFSDVVVKYFETGLRVKGQAAILTFQRWKIDPNFIAQHKKQLISSGFEFPMEHVFFCKKI